MISVILPVYNVEGYLNRCVESILHQDFDQPYEIILVDDGSTDQSGKMCDRFAMDNPGRISVIHKKNGGLSSARNEGVLHAKGEWVSFIDSDDYVSPQYLSRLYYLIDKFKADMAVLSVKRTLEGNEIKEHTPRVEDFVLDKKAAFYEIYVNRHFSWYAYAKLYRKEILLKHPFPDGFNEDSATIYLLVDVCDKVAFGDYMSEYHYLVRKGSLATSSLTEKHLRAFGVCDEIKEYIDKTYPEWQYVSVLLYQNALLQLINWRGMTKEQFSDVFKRYRPLFRKNVFCILRKKDLSFGTKYYAVVLCLTPSFYRIQRKIVKAVLGERIP